MAKQLMPKAELETRASDVQLTDEQFLKIGLFAQLKRKPSLDKFPGAMVLRRYRKGEVIFRQGEAGWTAFYTLTSEDLLAIEGKETKPAPDAPKAKPATDLPKEKQPATDLFKTLSPAEMKTLLLRVQELQATPNRNDELRTVASVNLAIARPTPKERGGLFQRLQRRLFGGQAPRGEKPLYVPIDGPRDLDYQTLQSFLYEGELFGEMSCLYRTPRSATVVASRDCYLLEMLRNILDQLQKDPAYKARTDELYRKRVFELYLRQLAVFHDLTDSQLQSFRQKLDLVTFESGQLICDEHERSDCVYVIRGGLVRVVKKASALLGQEHIRNWKDLGAALVEGEKQSASPRGKIWSLLSDQAKELLRTAPDASALSEGDRLEILHALNDVLKQRALADAQEFQALLATPRVAERAEEFPEKKRKDWSDGDLRRFHRLLVENIFAGCIRTHRRRVGPDCVLSYCARGEFIGEMGLMEPRPRSATCVAFGHPQEGAKDSGQVELIRIPAAVFQDLLQASPVIRQKIEKEMALRQKRTQQILGKSIWDEDSEVIQSKRFEELGLIQGQRLMLIDLDRCTRCDECVQACVNTHSDGRSRLFLDGPRFDKYLVPATCRSCLDPVCMIGCPVGSIHRGNNGQIEIEDWCIGCGLCANNCPYGSIQMHDIGIVPEASRGWRFRSAAAVKSPKWQRLSFNDADWAVGEAPFCHDRQFHDQLTGATRPNLQTSMTTGERAILFRFEFRLASYLLRSDGQFKLELTSTDAAATLWVNGHELQPEKPKAGKRDYWLPPKASTSAAAATQAQKSVAKPTAPPQVLRSGRNVFAVRVTPTPGSMDVLLAVRLDAINKPEGLAHLAEEVTEKLVTERAVVCDLCSSSPGQVPACVNACPHDAAMRVDARMEFPAR
jgi:CRP-like cAMP-binding protein/Fe-S-cluster-containing hydrogenase component 2